MNWKTIHRKHVVITRKKNANITSLMHSRNIIRIRMPTILTVTTHYAMARK